MNIAWLSHFLHSGRCGRHCESRNQKSLNFAQGHERVERPEDRREESEYRITNIEFRILK